MACHEQCLLINTLQIATELKKNSYLKLTETRKKLSRNTCNMKQRIKFAELASGLLGTTELHKAAKEAIKQPPQILSDLMAKKCTDSSVSALFMPKSASANASVSTSLTNASASTSKATQLEDIAQETYDDLDVNDEGMGNIGCHACKLLNAKRFCIVKTEGI